MTPGHLPMWTQRLMWIVWPAFMSACLLELVVFAVVDPLELHWSGQTLAWSRQSVYAAAFFFFWAAAMLSGALTALLLVEPSDAANAAGLRDNDAEEVLPG